MKTIPVQNLHFKFDYPVKEEPSWKNIVDRWYQLDAYAYGLAEAYSVWKPKLSTPPSLIFLASPQASNETDFQFAQGGAVSPAKFVHTLPNIRCSPLCQVMDWAGPVICVQKDPFTQVHALREAAAYPSGAIWVLSVFKGERQYEAQLFVLNAEHGLGTLEIQKKCENPQQEPFKTDTELQEWLSSGTQSLNLPGHYELRKRHP